MDLKVEEFTLGNLTRFSLEKGVSIWVVYRISPSSSSLSAAGVKSSVRPVACEDLGVSTDIRNMWDFQV